MPLGIWSFEHPFLGWKDLWNSSSLYCGRWCNSQVIKHFDTQASISSLGWKDPGTSKTLLWSGRCLWASGALNISFWGGRISGTSVPCIVVDSAIHKLVSALTLKLQYQVWGGRILELQKPCFEAEDAFRHPELWTSVFGVEGSLELQFLVLQWQAQFPEMVPHWNFNMDSGVNGSWNF